MLNNLSCVTLGATLLSWGWMLQYFDTSAKLGLFSITATALILNLLIGQSWRNRLFAVVLPLLLLPGSIVITWQAVLRFFPPATINGYPTMPVGQALLGLLAGAMLGLGLSAMYFYRRPKPSSERLFLATMFGLFGLGLMADLWMRGKWL